jgi:uncharacterized protein
MTIVLFALAIVACLLLVPLGLPGTWLMIAAAFVFNYLAPGQRIGWLAISFALCLAFLAEALEWTLAARYAKKYGGSKRAGWGAFLGGLIGAFLGVPIPIIGSVIGAFAGAFGGALVAEFTRRESSASTATHVATGALLGRVVATALKMAIAFVIGVLLVAAAWV